jgi:hypothetical protein
MKFKAIFGIVMIWILLVPSGFSVSKPAKEMFARGGADIVAPDEQPAKYPALDLEDLCKHAKNPKCEAIVDSFCIKSCNAKLCSKYGSIRGMCRLMCEAEDLLPQCSQMGSSGAGDTVPQKDTKNLYRSQEIYQQGYLPPQGYYSPQ